MNFVYLHKELLCEELSDLGKELEIPINNAQYYAVLRTAPGVCRRVNYMITSLATSYNYQ